MIFGCARKRLDTRGHEVQVMEEYTRFSFLLLAGVRSEGG